MTIKGQLSQPHQDAIFESNQYDHPITLDDVISKQPNETV